MLGTVKIVLFIVMGCSLLWLFIKLFKGKTPKKVLLWSVLSGLCSLMIISLLGEKFSSTLYINPYTVGVSAVLGIPGVILMMAAKILWQL